MSCCPKCNRNSLEYSERRKIVWCLYVEDCTFEEQVESYESYVAKHSSDAVAGLDQALSSESELVS